MFIPYKVGNQTYWRRAEPMTIGEIIREKRMVLGMTQSQLGERCGYKAGCSARNIVKLWEADKRDIPTRKLRAVSDALQLPLTSLIP